MSPRKDRGLRILIFGIGNPARQDDGLGPAFISRLEKARIHSLTLEADYQLQVEDALLFSEHQLVVVVDAIKSGRKPFVVKRIEPAEDSSFTTHHLSPEALLYLTQILYERSPEVWLLGIRGYKFSLGEKLSPKARANFDQAYKCFIKFLKIVTTSGLASAIIDFQPLTSSRGKRHGAKEKRIAGS
ncbi:MAG TPA: hydrogenase maturation protease [Candidatus Saccharicenans sp.]|nr:hydrogenase maturation protease [Candidatus Saccharicenans sp.]HOJ27397.1 hydrogenase maturation protease [Candidatus Saccharicenans sp.]HOL46473.1 hydrogenase maturation protease [Candidatus Saccharicenans sp.]HPP24793.1 hydrogenase maturation protease [Candidatus Saccharicenans sp.]HQM73761.1 hydrogenase maturation protease [Candidatus Saccharicenans sp.]